MQLWKERTVIELEFYWSGGSCNGVKPQWIYYTKAIDNGSAHCFVRDRFLVIWLLLLKQKRMRFKPIKSWLFCWTDGQEQ